MKKIIIPLNAFELLPAFINVLEAQFSLTPEDNVMARSALHKMFPEDSKEEHAAILMVAAAIPKEHDALVLWLMPNQKLRVMTDCMSTMPDDVETILVPNVTKLAKAIESMHEAMHDHVGGGKNQSILTFLGALPRIFL